MADGALTEVADQGRTSQSDAAGIEGFVDRVGRRFRPLMPGSPYLWITVAMVVVGTVLHYIEPLAFYDDDLPLQLTRHNMNRILFMVPVVYAGFIFGPRGGFITLAAVTAAMLPRAILISQSPPDAVSEVFIIGVVSSFIILWFRGQQREREHRVEILRRLELARQELAYQVEVIRKNERRLAAVNEVCCVTGQSLDLPYLLLLILDKVVTEIGVEAAMIFLRDHAGEKLDLVAYQGISHEFAGAMATLRVGEGFNGRVAESGESMVVEDSQEDPRLTIPQVAKDGVRSQLIVPLRAKGTTIGTLCVATRSIRQFSTDDKDLLTAIGGQVGMAIENAGLYREARASEERYRDLFENATVAIFVQDMQGYITAANKASTRLTGYAQEKLIGSNVSCLFPSSASTLLSQVREGLLEGKTVDPYDIQLIRRDGGESILSITTRLVQKGGEPQGFQHIAIDITERRRMQESLNYYMSQVLTAQEEERKRIARDLHDDTAQSLLLILQRMDGISYSSPQRLPNGMERQMEEVRGLVLESLANLRRITRDLRPQILDDLGLVAALEWLAEEMERQHLVKTEVRVEGKQRAVPAESQLLLFRIAQEALSNVRRHSAASEARVVLKFGEEAIHVSVEDNGRGFRVPDSLSDLAGDGKLGVLGMFERARLAGGSLSVESSEEKGTKISATLPPGKGVVGG